VYPGGGHTLYWEEPVGLAGTILASGVIRLVARWWNGQGHFEDLFALLGFSGLWVSVASVVVFGNGDRLACGNS
jgi:hypothetical protein